MIFLIPRITACLSRRPRQIVPLLSNQKQMPPRWNRPQRRGLLRRLYNWVLSWADSPHGMIALAGISFAESSFFPIPPDVLQIALSVGKPKKSYLFAAVSVIASVLGAVVGWAIGWGLWQFVDTFFIVSFPGLRLKNSTMSNLFTKRMLFYG